jgi:hypothetical protein
LFVGANVIRPWLVGANAIFLQWGECYFFCSGANAIFFAVGANAIFLQWGRMLFVCSGANAIFFAVGRMLFVCSGANAIFFAVWANAIRPYCKLCKATNLW